jgi:MFS transporter, FHS family, glucose/mannose:H+ symporter
MSNWRIKLSLFLNYFVFAMLLNSVGTVILQVQNCYGVSKTDASILEAFKDLSIAIVSFIVGSFIARIGYKKSMLIALALVTAACLIMPSVPFFVMNKLLFAIVGASFALIKVSVYSTIGLVTNNEKEHASLMNFIESFFMVGIFVSSFAFAYFLDEKNPQSSGWLNVYYFLSAISGIAFLLLWSAPLDESEAQVPSNKPIVKDFTDMFALLAVPLVIIFVISAFLSVLIEQGITSWMPTFNNEVLKLPLVLSVQMSSILAISTAIGRFSAGVVMRRFHWFGVIATCLVLAATLILVVLPLANDAQGKIYTGWSDAPLAAFAFPLIGFLLAPIYPAICSMILSSLPKLKHGTMTSLILVFSALGGTFGSFIMARIFEKWGGQTGFYCTLFPLTFLLIALFLFNKMGEKSPKQDIYAK